LIALSKTGKPLPGSLQNSIRLRRNNWLIGWPGMRTVWAYFLFGIGVVALLARTSWQAAQTTFWFTAIPLWPLKFSM